MMMRLSQVADVVSKRYQIRLDEARTIAQAITDSRHFRTEQDVEEHLQELDEPFGKQAIQMAHLSEEQVIDGEA
jgi:hypothetical protein